jgi:carboxyl-terminal processing protease
LFKLNLQEEKEVLYRDKKIEYDGPFIMVNSFSASASEILAAAIKITSAESSSVVKQTYGKGTVQNVIDLNQFVRNNEVGDLGALKLLRKNSTGLMVALLN